MVTALVQNPEPVPMTVILEMTEEEASALLTVVDDPSIRLLRQEHPAVYEMIQALLDAGIRYTVL